MLAFYAEERADVCSRRSGSVEGQIGPRVIRYIYYVERFDWGRGLGRRSSSVCNRVGSEDMPLRENSGWAVEPAPLPIISTGRAYSDLSRGEENTHCDAFAVINGRWFAWRHAGPSPL